MRFSRRQINSLLVRAFIGWILCGATMGVGRALTTEQNSLYIHALLAPIYFVVMSLNYFRKPDHVSPVAAACAFVLFVVLADLIFVAGITLRSFEMYASILGTWIPLASIFLSTYLTGLVLERKQAAAA